VGFQSPARLLDTSTTACTKQNLANRKVFDSSAACKAAEELTQCQLGAAKLGQQGEAADYLRTTSFVVFPLVFYIFTSVSLLPALSIKVTIIGLIEPLSKEFSDLSQGLDLYHILNSLPTL
jgi:hypothetical protein